MTNPPILNADDFWHFSLALYGKSGVKETCLAAQDRWQADVNILLLCAYLRGRHLTLNEHGWKALIAASDYWQAKILRPIRAARKAAVGTPDYEQLKQDEIEAEKDAQLELLHAVADHYIPLDHAQDDPVSYYLRRVSIGDAALKTALEACLRPD